MNKINNLVIILAMVLLIGISTVSALSVSGSTDYSVCQCETQKQVYTVCSDTSGEYSLSLEGSGAKWLSIAPTSLNITGSNCQVVYAFLTPECYATAGSYPTSLVITGPESRTVDLSVNVEQCHTIDYTITPKKSTSNPCEDNIYDLHVKNTGNFVDEFVLVQEGLEDSWITFPRESFVLSPNQELNTQFTVKSTCSTSAGSYPFEMTLSNILTNVTQSIDLTQKINGIIPFETTFSSSATINDINSCAETGTDYNFYIKNTSPVDDEYTLEIDSSIISLDKKVVALKVGESATVTLSVDAAAVQNITTKLKVQSKQYDANYTQSVKVNINDCENILVNRISKGSSSCFEGTEQLFRLYNNGTERVTANVTVSGIDLNSADANGTNYTIDAGKFRDFYVRFAPKSIGEKQVSVVAKTTNAISQYDFNFSVLNCYDVKVSVPKITACPNSIVREKITLTNNGTVDQTVNINVNKAPWITFDSSKVNVPAGESVDVYFTANVPSTVELSYILSLISYSGATSDEFVKAVLREQDISTDLVFELNSQEKCYSFSAGFAMNYLDINCCQGKVVELNIKNDGSFVQNISLKKIAPPWVDFSDTNIVLDVNETKTVYVYFHPPAGTNARVTYTIEIKNQVGITKTLALDLNVFGGYCGSNYIANVSIGSSVPTDQNLDTNTVIVNFVVTNDTNYGFTIDNVSIKDFNTTSDFNNGVLLQPKESTIVKLIVPLKNGSVPSDQNVAVQFETSIGTLTKYQVVNFSSANPQFLNISGLFGEFTAPIAGLLLLLIILVVILVFVSRAKK